VAETTAETPVEAEETYDEVTTFESDAVESEFTSESMASRFGDPQPAAGTGRRKQSIARVRIVPGSGKWKINGRTLEGYFPNKVHQQEVNEPFKVLELDNRYDVVARISGGGISGQAGALRLGVARALNEADVDNNRAAVQQALSRLRRGNPCRVGRIERLGGTLCLRGVRITRNRRKCVLM
jgi:small subunit ribosomal protein S9